MYLKCLLLYCFVVLLTDAEDHLRADCMKYTMLDDKTLLDNYTKPEPGLTTLTTDWYRMNASNQGVIVRECPKGNVCGTTKQAWMADSIPEAGDQYSSFNRTICIRHGDNCCARNITIEMMNCLFYLIARLEKLQGDERYCFYSHTINLRPTPAPTTSKTTSTTTSTSSSTTTSTSSSTTTSSSTPRTASTSTTSTIKRTGITTNSNSNSAKPPSTQLMASPKTNSSKTSTTAAPGGNSVTSSNSNQSQLKSTIRNTNMTWTTPSPDDTDGSSFPIALIAGIAAGILLLILAIILALLVGKKLKRRKNGSTISNGYFWRYGVGKRIFDISTAGTDILINQRLADLVDVHGQLGARPRKFNIHALNPQWTRYPGLTNVHI